MPMRETAKQDNISYSPVHTYTQILNIDKHISWQIRSQFTETETSKHCFIFTRFHMTTLTFCSP